MSTVEKYAVDVLHTLSEEKLHAFITLFADENTIARMESELIASDPDRKHYDSFADIMEEIEGEDE